MSEYQTTETDVSELLESYDDVNEIMLKNNHLQMRIDTLIKQEKDKEFEHSNEIALITSENEKLKKMVISYEELINHYKKDNSNSNDESNLIINSKSSELEKKLLNSEQLSHNLKRENYTLNSIIEDLKFEIENLKKNAREGEDSNNNFFVNENDIKVLLEDIDELKKEKAEMSEKALNIIAEKELTILDLISELEQIKNQAKPIDDSRLQQSKLISQFEEELCELKHEIEKKENNWENEKGQMTFAYITLENTHRANMNELESEISNLKNEIFNLEMEKGHLEKELITDKSSIKNEIEYYSNIIKSSEEQKEMLEGYYKIQTNTLKKEISELETLNSQLRETNMSLEKQLSELKIENSNRVDSIYAKIKSENSEKINEIQNLRNLLEVSEREKETLKREYEQNKKNTEKGKGEYKDLLAQLKSIKENYENEKSKWEEKVTQLEKNNEQERTSFKKQIKEIKSTQDYKEEKSNDEINLMDYNSEENPTILKNKVKRLEEENIKLNNIIKLNNNKNSCNFRLTGEIDILKREKVKLQTEMSQIKEMYEVQIEELQKGCKIFKEKDDNLIQNKFLKEQIEILKKEFEDLKIIKDNHIKKLKDDIEESMKCEANAKLHLAQSTFEKEYEVIKYKTLCKKLKMKLNNQTPLIRPANSTDNINYNTNHSSETTKKQSFFQSFFK